MIKSQVVLLSLFFLLLVVCVGLILIGDSMSLATRDAILPIASDGFKLVLGALVGALSAIIGTNSK